jgi:hypothetical protein
MFRPCERFAAIHVFAFVHFSACLDFIPAVFVCVEILFGSFVVVKSNRFVRVGEGHVFATTFLCFGHLTYPFGETGAGGGAVIEGGGGGSFVPDVGGVEGAVESSRCHRGVFRRGRRVQDVAVMHRGLKITPARHVHVVVEHLWLMHCLTGGDEGGEMFMMR